MGDDLGVCDEPPRPSCAHAPKNKEKNANYTPPRVFSWAWGDSQSSAVLRRPGQNARTHAVERARAGAVRRAGKRRQRTVGEGGESLNPTSPHRVGPADVKLGPRVQRTDPAHRIEGSERARRLGSFGVHRSVQFCAELPLELVKKEEGVSRARPRSEKEHMFRSKERIPRGARKTRFFAQWMSYNRVT